MIIRRRRFLLLGLLLGACSSPPRPAPERPSEIVNEAPVFNLADRPLPTKAEWLRRHLEQPEKELDLVEMATVLACSRLRIERAYSTIPRSLEPHVKRAARRLRPGASADEKIQALNQEVLPAIQSGCKREYQWLMETLGGGEGNCAVTALLYLIAADAIQLRLEATSIPNHVFLSHLAPERRRNIETTGPGQHLSTEEYRKFISDDPFNPETLAEHPDALEMQFNPMTRRQFAALLMTQSGGRMDNLEDVESAAQLSPDFYYPVKVLAARFIAAKNYARAIEMATTAIRMAPHLPGLYAVRATGHLLASKPTSALEDLDKALQLSPRYGVYHELKADILFRQEQYGEAVRAATLAVENTPGAARFWTFRARIFESLKKYREAIDDCTKALALEPRNAPTYLQRARMWAMIGNEAEYDADRKKAQELQAKPK